MFALDYNGFVIHRRIEDGLVCLTDMWKAQGSIKTQQVNQWLGQEGTCDLLLQLMSEIHPDLKPVCDRVLKSKPEAGSGRQKESKRKFRAWSSEVKQLATESGLVTTKSGKTGGTYGIPKIAIAYAENLSPEFHSWALTAIEERIEEEANPEKALSRGYDRAVKGWKKQGYSDTDIDVLTQCVITRKDLTGTLKEHGVGDGKPTWVKSEQMAYAVVTNEIYKPLLPGTASDYRKRNNLPSKTNVREHLTQSGEITKRAAIMLAETMARETIRTEDRYGFVRCQDACGKAGKKVARVFE